MDELERVRRKVISGERLSDAEFAVLDRAVARERTRSLRLTLAHALMNAEEDRRALEQLRALERDRPADPEVQMALARALLGMDRYPEAEAALKEALRLRPGDPEALKALAALLLRHGELERARALVADALQRDPFDGEARLLKEELEAVDPATFAPKLEFTALEFGRAVLEALTRAQVPHLRRGKDLLLKLSGSDDVARLDLPSLHADAVARGQPLAVAVRQLVEELRALQARMPDSAEALLAQVLPVLRPSGFDEVASGAVHREGPGGLLIYYALEDAELLRYVPPAAIDALGVSLEALDTAAFGNLEARPAELAPITLSPDGVVSPGSESGDLAALLTGDGHDGARLLTVAQRDRLAARLGEGPWFAHLGRRELVVIARGPERLGALPVAPDGIEGVFRLDPDGRLSLA